MRALINKDSFLKAVEYVSANYFSKPYSITQLAKRWFNQLAMIELENGKILHLHGTIAQQYIDITLDGTVVPPEDIELVMKFYAPDSNQEAEKRALNQNMFELINQLNGLDKDKEPEKYKSLAQQISEQDAKASANKAKAKQLYEDIVVRGQSSLNVGRLKEDKGTIKNIVYRPNHGLTHSVRAAFAVTAIHAYVKEHGAEGKDLTEADLETLQMMMLFSVVGRRDETGFNDMGFADKGTGRETYTSFRATSGREFLKYSQENRKDVYGGDLEKLYRDAIVVELMGFSSIDEAMSQSVMPAVFIDYVIAKEASVGEVVDREKAVTLITQRIYTLEQLYPLGEIRNLADSKIEMMKYAHSLDLVRCYPLYANKEGGSKSLSNFNVHLTQAKFYDFTDNPDAAKLTSFYKLMRCGFDTLVLTGHNSTFGLLSAEVFDAKKADILAKIKEQSDTFTLPKNQATLLEAAKASKTEIESNFGTSYGVDQLLNNYRKLIILKVIATELSAAPKLNPDKRMFNFQHSKGNPYDVDHHKNAVSLVNALQTITPVTGVTSLPVISAVEHDRSAGKVTAFFDDRKEAEDFVGTYVARFGVRPIITEKSAGTFAIEVDRKNYKQLVNDRLVEFRLVTIPAAVNREASLVDEDGSIDALSLVAHSRGLTRVVNTSLVGGVPDYDYLFRAFEDPVHERYTPPIQEVAHFPVDLGKYYDPSSGACQIRTPVSTPLPHPRFQPPVTEPIKLADKIADGWPVGKPGEGEKPAAKNTIYTTKMAYTLLPPHGKVIAFDGYSGKKTNYFAIGVLSDISEVDLKDERYIWTQNMDTFNKFWIRDVSVYNRNVYKYLKAQLDVKGNPIRYSPSESDPDGEVALDKSRIRAKCSSPAVLIAYLEKRAEGFLKRIDSKHYRPTDSAIHDFKRLLGQERKEYLKQAKGDKPAQKRIKQIYSALDERLNKEAARKHPKYAISLRELIEQQKKTQDVGKHNEILASNTKAATRALYAPKDTLFDRLNLAYHAMKIKKQYQYDVPLLVMSDNKPPYYYNETLIKADLHEAYTLLKDGKFPYDKTVYEAFELDSKGNVVLDSQGKRIAKKDEHGDVVTEPKNLRYQQELLVNLFKVAIEKLTDIDELIKGEVLGESFDKEIDDVVSFIVKDMELVGGLERETELMTKVFAEDNIVNREQFFLRAAALGHKSLMVQILDSGQLKITEPLLEKAIKFAAKNNHTELSNYLNTHPLKDEKRALEVILHHLGEPINADLKDEGLFSAIEGRLRGITQVNKRYTVLNSKIDLPDMGKKIQQAGDEVLLNPASRNDINKAKLSEFMTLLGSNPEYIEPYARILAANQMVNLEYLNTAHEKHGVVHVSKAMSLIAERGEEAATQYLLSLEVAEINKNVPPEMAEDQLPINKVDKDAHTEAIVLKFKEALEIIKEGEGGPREDTIRPP